MAIVTIGTDPGGTGGLVMLRDGKLAASVLYPLLDQPIGYASLGKAVMSDKNQMKSIDFEALRMWVIRNLDASDKVTCYVENPQFQTKKFIKGEMKDFGGPDQIKVHRLAESAMVSLRVVFRNHDSKFHFVNVKHWQAWLFRHVPKVCTSERFIKLGIPYEKVLTSKQRSAYLCLLEWGPIECVKYLKQSDRSWILFDGLTDAACIALFGEIHQKRMPNLVGYPTNTLVNGLHKSPAIV